MSRTSVALYGPSSGFGRAFLATIRARRLSWDLDLFSRSSFDSSGVEACNALRESGCTVRNLHEKDLAKAHAIKDYDYFLFFAWPNLGAYDSSLGLEDWQDWCCSVLGNPRLANATLIFLGSSLEYGTVEGAIDTRTQVRPTTPYGHSKLNFGRLLSEQNRCSIHFRLFYPWSDHKTRPTLRSSYMKCLRDESFRLTVGPENEKRDFFNGDKFVDILVTRMCGEIRSSGYTLYNVGSGHSRSASSLVREWEKQDGFKVNCIANDSCLVAQTGKNFWAKTGTDLVQVDVV